MIEEQRGLCAYTGIRIDGDSSHIEHLVPQSHSTGDEDTQYSNLVACYPQPGAAAKFGAVKKGNWPPPNERASFVSPRSEGCENRFAFDFSGNISAKRDDAAANTTIARLGLNHKVVVGWRKAAIDATLRGRSGGPFSLEVSDAERRLNELEQSEAGQGQLAPFCFVLKQALRKHIEIKTRAQASGDPPAE